MFRIAFLATTIATVLVASAISTVGQAQSSGWGWGTLTGQFVYDGPVPAVRYLPTSGLDVEFLWSIPHVVDERLIVDPDSSGIKNVVVFARKVSRIHPSYEAPDARSRTMEIRDCVFRPHVLVTDVTQAITLRNADPIVHTGTILLRLEPSINILLGPGGEIHHSFWRHTDVPIAVKCHLCPWTRAYVWPRENPYFAVTDENGRFEIPNLPAHEEIEFQVWHEDSWEPLGRLPAKPQWEDGRFRATVPDGGIRDLGTIEVAPSAFRTK
jgi:hypothetical protein